MTKRDTAAVHLRAFTTIFSTIMLAAALPGAAHADYYDVGAYGGGGASTSISFTIPFGVAPDAVAPDGSAFTYSNIFYYQGGNFDCPCQGDFTFYILDADHLGGVDSPAGHFSGVQLFTGSASAPTLRQGDFTITFINPASFYDGATGEVSIDLVREGPAPVPEPTSWALLVAGLALTGAALRRRPADVQVQFG